MKEHVKIYDNLYKDQKGEWSYRKKDKGFSYRVSLRTKDLDEAINKCCCLDELFVQIIKQEKSNQTESLPFNQVIQDWFSHKKKHLNPSTIKSYKSVLNNFIIKGPFVDKPINMITTDDIERWYFNFKKTIGNNYIRKILDTISSIFSYAMRNGLIEYNPVIRLEKPKRTYKFPNIFSFKEIECLLKNIDPFYLDYQKMLFYSGLRQSEINDLRVSDIDLNKRTIWITNGKRYCHARNRISIMDNQVFEIISKQIQKAFKVGSITVFFNKQNNSIKSAHYNRKIWKLLFENTVVKKAGIKYRTISVCRYTYISRLSDEGMGISCIKKKMGYS